MTDFVRAWVPKCGISLRYDPFAFTALMTARRRAGTLRLESRRDGQSWMEIEASQTDNEKTPEVLASRVKDRLAKVSGASASVRTRAGIQQPAWLADGDRAAALGAVVMKADRPQAVAVAAGPPGHPEELTRLFDGVVATIEGRRREPRCDVTCAMDLRGTLRRDPAGTFGAIVDLLVGPVPEDLHVSVIQFRPRPDDDQDAFAVQGRQLLAFARTVRGQAVNWGCSAVPAGGYILLQFPRFALGRNHPGDGFLTVQGVRASGGGLRQDAGLRALRPELVLRRPVPGSWRANNCPDELSIHRLAATIVDDRLMVAQRGAIDYTNAVVRSPGAKDQSLDADPSFGAEVVAPCAGVIVRAVSDRPDQQIGDRDEEHPRGNEVCILREDGLVVVMAHLRRDSLVVRESDTITVGQMLAQVGNSGRSSRPHLHMHVADTAEFVADGVAFRHEDG